MGYWSEVFPGRPVRLMSKFLDQEPLELRTMPVEFLLTKDFETTEPSIEAKFLFFSAEPKTGTFWLEMREMLVQS